MGSIVDLLREAGIDPARMHWRCGYRWGRIASGTGFHCGMEHQNFVWSSNGAVADGYGFHFQAGYDLAVSRKG